MLAGLQQALTEKDILLSLNKDIASIRDKNELFNRVYPKLCALFTTTDVFICKLDRDAGTLNPFVRMGSSDKLAHPGYSRIIKADLPVHDGFLDTILQSSTPVAFDMEEVSQWEKPPFYISVFRETGLKQSLSAVLYQGNEPIGLLTVFTSRPGSFTPHHHVLIGQIADHVSIVVANILTTEEIRSREAEKSALLAFSNKLSSVRDKKDLSAVIHTRLKELIYYDDFAICLVDEAIQYHAAFLHVFEGERKTHPDYDKIVTAKYPVNDGFFDKVLTTAGPTLFDIEEMVKAGKAPGYIEYDYINGTRQIIGVPLSDGTKPIGAFFILNRQQQPADALALRMIEGISYQLSIAVANIIANTRIKEQLEEISKYKELLEEEKKYLQHEASAGYSYNDIVGSGPAMQQVFHLLSQVSFANSTVLLLGETGTGKELIARAIHNSSPRKDKLMVKVNCAAMPANLIESELFGHEKGSFTGANERRIGKFELANQGTLFLDEIGEMPPELQVKLLRAIQEKEIERIGGRTTIKTNVRIIAATNRHLQKEVDAGLFRSDLFYRLNVFPITLPPLRERKEDIPALAAHFISKFSKSSAKPIRKIAAKALKELMAYSWPGNVRELEHLIERSVLMTNGEIIREVHLPTRNREELKYLLEEDYLKTFQENERDHIIRVLQTCNGKIFGPGGAAQILDLRVSTLNSKIKKLGIKKEKLFSTPGENT